MPFSDPLAKFNWGWGCKTCSSSCPAHKTLWINSLERRLMVLGKKKRKKVQPNEQGVSTWLPSWPTSVKIFFLIFIYLFIYFIFVCCKWWDSLHKRRQNNPNTSKGSVTKHSRKDSTSETSLRLIMLSLNNPTKPNTDDWLESFPQHLSNCAMYFWLLDRRLAYSTSCTYLSHAALLSFALAIVTQSLPFSKKFGTQHSKM
jgi:hypothetical protein